MCGVVLFPMASCVRTELVCAPAPARDRSADIIALVGPPRLVPDSVAPTDRIVGRVLGQFQRRPIRGALLELDSIGTRTTTDSAGNFILAMPPLDHAVRHIRAIGYLMRRDSLRLASLAGHRLEVVLPDAYAFGDIKGMPCIRQRRRWPFWTRPSTARHPNIRQSRQGLFGGSPRPHSS
jgi:hypothetical protein